MAKATSNGGGSSSNAGAGDRMAAAREARGKGPMATVTLDDRQKFALRQLQGARSSLKKAQDALKNGWEPNASLIQACADITSSVGKMLFD